MEVSGVSAGTVSKRASTVWYRYPPTALRVQWASPHTRRGLGQTLKDQTESALYWALEVMLSPLSHACATTSQQSRENLPPLLHGQASGLSPSARAGRRLARRRETRGNIRTDPLVSRIRKPSCQDSTVCLMLSLGPRIPRRSRFCHGPRPLLSKIAASVKRNQVVRGWHTEYARPISTGSPP